MSLALSHNVSPLRAKLTSIVMFISNSFFVILSNKIKRKCNLRKPTTSLKKAKTLSFFWVISWLIPFLGHSFLPGSLSPSSSYSFNNNKNTQMKYICLGFPRILLAVSRKRPAWFWRQCITAWLSFSSQGILQMATVKHRKAFK